MVEHGERGNAAEGGADPEDAEGAGAEHGADRRIECMAAAAQYAGGDFIEIADRFKQQDAEDADARTFDHGGIRCEQRGEKAVEADDQGDRDATCYGGQCEAEVEDAAASCVLAGCTVLAGEGGRGLRKGRDDIVGEVFEVHGDGASGDGGFAEAVDRGLDEDIGEAENGALHSGGDAGFQDAPGDGRIWRSARGSGRKCILIG